MRNLGLKFITILFLFLLPSYSVFGAGEDRSVGGSGGKTPQSPSGRMHPRSSSSSENGSDRRASAASSSRFENFKNAENPSHFENIYNPVTGWHTVSEQNEVVNYRGTRKVVPNEALKVSCVSAEKYWNGSTIVEICFNQEINPRSFSSSNVKINGKSVDNDVKFKFSRKGDSVKIQIPAQENNFSLCLGNVEAFDGEKIPEIELSDISVK